MRIVIDTDGQGCNTQILFNGELQKTLIEFNLSVKMERGVKVQMIKDIDGKKEFLSYFGGDFKKYDEINPNKEN